MENKSIRISKEVYDFLKGIKHPGQSLNGVLLELIEIYKKQVKDGNSNER